MIGDFIHKLKKCPSKEILKNIVSEEYFKVKSQLEIEGLEFGEDGLSKKQQTLQNRDTANLYDYYEDLWSIYQGVVAGEWISDLDAPDRVEELKQSMTSISDNLPK